LLFFVLYFIHFSPPRILTSFFIHFEIHSIFQCDPQSLIFLFDLNYQRRFKQKLLSYPKKVFLVPTSKWPFWMLVWRGTLFTKNS
jgi:hypothetical protein